MIAGPAVSRRQFLGALLVAAAAVPRLPAFFGADAAALPTFSGCDMAAGPDVSALMQVWIRDGMIVILDESHQHSGLVGPLEAAG